MRLKEIADQELLKTKDVLLAYNWEDPIAYGLWLAQTYTMVAHSTRLVAMAGACVPLGQESLHGRFVDHSREERGHQAVCVADIKNLGYNLADFPILFQSKAMYQVQYYWIQHRCAASFFGYTLSLECLAEKYGPKVANRVLNAHGKKSSQFLLLHSEDDQEHAESAFKHIKNLTPAEAAEAEENLIMSCDIYRAMLVEAKSVAASLSHLRSTKKAG